MNFRWMNDSSSNEKIDNFSMFTVTKIINEENFPKIIKISVITEHY